MTPISFFEQWQRLVLKFGARQMNDPLKISVSQMVKEIPEDSFKRAVDFWMEKRSVDRAPKLSEFQAFCEANKKRPPRERLQPIHPDKTPQERIAHMSEVLKPIFGGVESAKHALEIALHKRLMSKQNKKDPNGAA